MVEMTTFTSFTRAVTFLRLLTDDVCELIELVREQRDRARIYHEKMLEFEQQRNTFQAAGQTFPDAYVLDLLMQSVPAAVTFGITANAVTEGRLFLQHVGLRAVAERIDAYRNAECTTYYDVQLTHFIEDGNGHLPVPFSVALGDLYVPVQRQQFEAEALNRLAQNPRTAAPAAVPTSGSGNSNPVPMGPPPLPVGRGASLQPNVQETPAVLRPQPGDGTINPMQLHIMGPVPGIAPGSQPSAVHPAYNSEVLLEWSDESSELSDSDDDMDDLPTHGRSHDTHPYLDPSPDADGRRTVPANLVRELMSVPVQGYTHTTHGSYMPTEASIRATFAGFRQQREEWLGPDWNAGDPWGLPDPWSEAEEEAAIARLAHPTQALGGVGAGQQHHGGPESATDRQVVDTSTAMVEDNVEVRGETNEPQQGDPMVLDEQHADDGNEHDEPMDVTTGVAANAGQEQGGSSTLTGAHADNGNHNAVFVQEPSTQATAYANTGNTNIDDDNDDASDAEGDSKPSDLVDAFNENDDFVPRDDDEGDEDYVDEKPRKRQASRGRTAARKSSTTKASAPSAGDVEALTGNGPPKGVAPPGVSLPGPAMSSTPRASTSAGGSNAAAAKVMPSHMPRRL